jgi:hypothetical protein
MITSVLVLLALVIGVGLYGGWQYVQGQYYVGVQNGNVAIFRGVDQDIAGISMSSLVQRTNLPIAEVPAGNQGMIRQTIAASDLAGAQSVVAQIQQGVSGCRQEWLALRNWQAAMIRYESQLIAFLAKRSKIRPTGNPGMQPPTPDKADCAPASAFGI